MRIGIGANLIGANVICEGAAESRLRFTVQGQVTRILQLASARFPDPLNSLQVCGFHFHRGGARDQVHAHHHPAGFLLSNQNSFRSL